jgi:hypothetical protein
VGDRMMGRLSPSTWGARPGASLGRGRWEAKEEGAFSLINRVLRGAR